MADDKFAFQGPNMSRRGLFKSGAGAAARQALPAAEAAADPLVDEAEHYGIAHHYLTGATETSLRKAIVDHPTLSRYADHAVRGLKKAAEFTNKAHHMEHLSSKA